MMSRRIGSLGALLLFGSVVLACGDDGGANCGEGTELVGGSCVPTDAGIAKLPDSGSETSLTCGPNTFMVAGKCQGLLPVGAACERGAQCESESCALMTEGFPGGYCTVPTCNDNRPCPTGSHCYYSSARDRSVCLAFCDPAQEVRKDNPYVCQPIPGTDLTLLTPSCNAVNSCPDQTACDKDAGKCVLRECDRSANDPCDTANSHRICYEDRRKLTKLGGLCLSQCDPKASKCSNGDRCQPLPEDPANTGICVPPVCSATAECPVGSVCEDAVCQPPPRCDSQGKCGDESTDCVGGAGGQCMPKCPSGDAKCSDLHAGLTCAQGIAATPVCLPEGSFPGSACRADKNNACDSVKVGSNSAKMVCENNTCLVACSSGGDNLCKGIKNTLSCASGIYDQAVCLPNGAYPGGPCDAANSCQDVNLSAGVSAKMLCKGNLCVFDCGSTAIGSSAPGTYCADIDASLTCATAAYPGSAVCLPAGSYPGGPCAHGTCGKLGDTQMVCEDNLCLLTCSTSSDQCATVESSLVCAHDIYAEDVCLPKGAFPGGPCGGTNHDQCAQDLQGNDEIDMQCVQGTCAVGCNEAGKWAGYGEAVCHFTDPSLTCAQAANDICVKACDNGACGTGYSCYDAGAVPAHENACLPNGSFPGAACGAGDVCGAGPAGSTMSCHSGRCLIDCNADFGSTKCLPGLSCLASQNSCLPNGSFPGATCASGNTCGAGPGGSTMSCHSGSCLVECSGGAGDTLCSNISPALTCSDAAGGLCLPACNPDLGPTKCPTGLSCLASENSCLPNGSFLGAACATGDVCSGSPNLVCVPSGSPVCAAGCSISNGQPAADAYCTGVGNAFPGTNYDTCTNLGGGLRICTNQP